MNEQVAVAVADITVDFSLQYRVRLNSDAVRDYQAAYAGGKKLPPVLLCRLPDGRLVLVDGFHRVEAARRLKLAVLPCRIEQGDMAAARRLARQANRENALRLTRADKANMVRETLREYPGWSDRSIAAECGVSNHTVRTIRRRQVGNFPPGTRTGRDGKAYRAHPAQVGNFPPGPIPYRPCVCCELSQDGHERLAEILTLGLDPAVVAESLRNMLHILDAETTQ